MQITVKNLQQQTFKVEVGEDETVMDLKKKIEAAKGSEYTATWLKLIFAGKFLDDNDTVSSYEIPEKSFVVVMINKPKPAPSIAAPEIKKTEDVQTVTESSSSSQSPNTPAVQETSNDPLEKTIQEIVDMGFPRDQVVRAMRASYNHPDRAVDYLISGSIPEVEDYDNIQTGNVGARSEEEFAFEDESDSYIIQSLASNPQFAELLQDIRFNPAILPRAMEQIRNSNPPLFQLISRNEELFAKLINGEDITPMVSRRQVPDGSSNSSLFAALESCPQFQQMRREFLTNPNPSSLIEMLHRFDQTNPEFSGLITSNPEQFLHMLVGQPRGQQITLTTEEREAIDRLKDLGFPEALCVQAYFACDKNEELAANFLFQQEDDD